MNPVFISIVLWVGINFPSGGNFRRTAMLGNVEVGVSRDRLICMIDSMFELDSVPVSLIRQLTELAGGKTVKGVAEKNVVGGEKKFPAMAMYKTFDKLKIFDVQPAASFPRESLLKLVGEDSLGAFCPPIVGVVTSNYGWRDKKMHKGIDIDLRRGEPVYCAFSGMVRVARREGGYGNVVIVRHYNGLETVYAHLSKIKVKVGDLVQSGVVLGLGGATGHATGTHLHFEARYLGQAMNPSNFISFTQNCLLGDSLVIHASKSEIKAFPAGAVVYIIHKGDSWNGLLNSFGMSSKELCSLNGTARRFYLRLGDAVRVR